ncbi:MAG: GDP-mannose 4,6-dehydratase [Bdellovibrionales bacterium]|nr:GDP-mannose 4,6-dehydratase [Bdellovibrionales bacterium]
MKILVAGGAGFIGSHLVDRLLAQDHHVDVIDNFVTGQKINLKHLADNENFELFSGDICNLESLPREKYDRIYNLASPASPIDFKKISIEILLTGSQGHLNLLQLAENCGARILFASTSEVYGDPLVNPQPETYYGNVNCRGERACYDEAKRFGEALTVNFQKYRGVNSRTVRIFNTYGPRMRPNDGRVIPNFFMQALVGQGLTIYGNGQQTRSLCYVSDMARGIETLMESDVDQPVNIGNTHEMTILEIADLINDLTGNNTPHIFQDLPENDPKVRQPDISRAKNLLGWRPQVDVREGLKETMEFFKTCL